MFSSFFWEQRTHSEKNSSTNAPPTLMNSNGKGKYFPSCFLAFDIPEQYRLNIR